MLSAMPAWAVQGHMEVNTFLTTSAILTVSCSKTTESLASFQGVIRSRQFVKKWETGNSETYNWCLQLENEPLGKWVQHM